MQLQVLLGYDKPRMILMSWAMLCRLSSRARWRSMEQKALAARPDYHAAHLGVAVADANVKLAYANGTADPTIEADYDRNGPDNSAAFNFSIPLRLFDRNQGNKETSKYTAQASRFTELARTKPGRRRCRSGLDRLYQCKDALGPLQRSLSRRSERRPRHLKVQL